MSLKVKCPAVAGIPVSQRKKRPCAQSGTKLMRVFVGKPRPVAPEPVKSTVPESAKNPGMPGGRPELFVTMCHWWMSWLMWNGLKVGIIPKAPLKL